MAGQLFEIIDNEGVCIGCGTKAEIEQLIADKIIPADVSLRPC